MLAIQNLGRRIVTPSAQHVSGQRFDGCFQKPVHQHRFFSINPIDFSSNHAPPVMGNSEQRVQQSFTAPSIAKANRETAVDYFSQEFDQLKKRPAFAHPLFKEMTNLAKEGTLTAEQFATFREIMLARIYLTMPSIAKLAEYALRNGDYKMFVTALQNLKEEGGDGDISKMHPLLAEQAFNEIGKYFGLPCITMKQSFDKLLNESRALRNYSDVIERIYTENPAYASLAQEAASGGDGKTGMMADLYEFFDALRPKLNADRYEKYVLPYFGEHLHLESDGTYSEHAEDGIECQHGRRALDDATRNIVNIDIAKRGLSTMEEFVDVQEKLFDTAQSAILSGLSSS